MTRPLCPLSHGQTDEGQPIDKPAAPGLVLCWTHRNRLERNIAELPDLYDALELRLHPSGPAIKPYSAHNSGDTATVNPRTGEEESPTFVSGYVVEVRDKVLATLYGWARVVAEDNQLSKPSTLDPHRISRFLLVHIDQLAADEDQAEEVSKWVSEVTRDAYSAAYPSGRRRIEIAPCGQPDCGGTLITVTSRTADLLPEVIWCDQCERRIPPSEWRRLRDLITGDAVDVILTVAQASDVYGVPVRTLSRWVSDGKLTNVGDGYPANIRAVEVEELLQSLTINPQEAAS